MSGPWHAVDGDGRDLRTGRTPRPPGWCSPAMALAQAPVPGWPVGVVDRVGRRLGVAESLGPGGDRVEALLGDVARPRAQPLDVEALAVLTPAGRLPLPVHRVSLLLAIEAQAELDPVWLAEVDSRRDRGRRALVAAGRQDDMEAALNLVILIATERFDPPDDTDVDAHAASGARLWLLTGAVVSALAGGAPDPFQAWGRLVAAGWWPVGPCGGRLVVSTAG
ncbi:MAG TPA: hypothetical protein VHA34_19455 [Actinomycetes bacterium]|nr:hypothetical protein [Actinomycetes bacterium]